MAEEKNDQEAHYAVEDYAVEDYAVDASQYTVPRGYYNDNGEFVEDDSYYGDPYDPNAYAESYNDPNAYYDYSQQQQQPDSQLQTDQAYDYSNAEAYNYDYYSQQYYDPAAATESSSTATPRYYPNLTLNNTTSTSTPVTPITPVSSATTPASSRPTLPLSAPGTKIYYPSQSNPNNPVGPIIITKSGYAGPNASTHSPSTATSGSSSNAADKKKKKKTTVRMAGGEVWEDKTLEDWDDNDYRLFAGDLGNEVTEELLFKTFSKYPSLIRTRVVRDNRTMKSKGYGFISFKDPDDFVRAWREMNGK